MFWNVFKSGYYKISNNHWQESIWPHSSAHFRSEFRSVQRCVCWVGIVRCNKDGVDFRVKVASVAIKWLRIIDHVYNVLCVFILLSFYGRCSDTQRQTTSIRQTYVINFVHTKTIHYVNNHLHYKSPHNHNVAEILTIV